MSSSTPPHVVCLGEALIDFVADTAGVSLAECPGFRKAPGGAPANVAVGLARLGVPAAFVGDTAGVDVGSPDQQQREAARIRVVLADDSVLLREGIASLLERAGFEIVGHELRGSPIGIESMPAESPLLFLGAVGEDRPQI